MKKSKLLLKKVAICEKTGILSHIIQTKRDIGILNSLRTFLDADTQHSVVPQINQCVYGRGMIPPPKMINV